VPAPLPALSAQAQRLIELGVDRLAGLSAAELRAAARTDRDDALLVVHPDRLPASALADLVEREGKRAFVVTDLSDVDEFAPIATVTLPAEPVYLLEGIDRGDHLSNRSPDEALPALAEAGRTPLTLGEGLHWLVQQPQALERNHCFMTIGSRRTLPAGRLDARTPALWISNGTGRDGRDRRNAPKIGWCWAGNRHTWLGFASASTRTAGLAS